MFNRIGAVLAPAQRAAKWDSAWVGKGEELATIQEGQELQRLIAEKTRKYRKAVTSIVSVALLVKVGDPNAKYAHVEELLTDGFPSDKPIDLFIEIEQGGTRDTENDIGGEEINPAQTKGHVMFNVFKTCAAINKNFEVGLAGLFSEIDRANEVGAGGGIANVVAKQLQENAADNAGEAEKKSKVEEKSKAEEKAAKAAAAKEAKAAAQK